MAKVKETDSDSESESDSEIESKLSQSLKTKMVINLGESGTDNESKDYYKDQGGECESDNNHDEGEDDDDGEDEFEQEDMKGRGRDGSSDDDDDYELSPKKKKTKVASKIPQLKAKSAPTLNSTSKSRATSNAQSLTHQSKPLLLGGHKGSHSKSSPASMPLKKSLGLRLVSKPNIFNSSETRKPLISISNTSQPPTCSKSFSSLSKPPLASKSLLRPFKVR
jgi:hypothetical protein